MKINNNSISHIIRIVLPAVVAMLMTLSTTSCSKKDEPNEPQASRTVLVYMAARNSLGSYDYDVKNIAEMEMAVAGGALNGGRLLVFRTDVNGNSTLFEITATGRKTLATYAGDGLMSVNAARLSGVIDDVKRLAPAQSYGLVLWSHSLGWLQNGMADEWDTATPQTWGEERGYTMNISTLHAALRGKGLDFVYFDCCYMACVEVAYELRDVTPTIVASAIELPARGMPYHLNIPHFFADTPDLIAAAQETFNYYNSLSGDYRTCAMSVINTSGMTTLASVSREIIQASGRVTPDDFTPQCFVTRGTCWFFDMAQYYEALATQAGRPDLFAKWQQALFDAVPYAAATPSIWNTLRISHHCGLSTYILRPDADPTIRGYNTLAWYKDVVKL